VTSSWSFILQQFPS